MKPRIWFSSGYWLCGYSARDIAGIGYTPKEAFDALTRLGPMRSRFSPAGGWK